MKEFVNFRYDRSSFQRDSYKKMSEDLQQKLADSHQTSRTAGGDGAERTSRVRALERELNKVLDENNVSRRFCIDFSLRFVDFHLSSFSNFTRITNK